MTRYLIPFLSAVIAFGGTALAQGKKAHITFISESGVPHSAVLMEYGDKQVWLGFKPKVNKAPVSAGKLDDSDRTKEVDQWVRFEVDAEKLAEVEKGVRKEFEDANYTVGVNDCVNLSVAFAKGLDLKTPKKPNFLPGKLVDHLADLNASLKPTTGTGKDQFPWKK